MTCFRFFGGFPPDSTFADGPYNGSRKTEHLERYCYSTKDWPTFFSTMDEAQKSILREVFGDSSSENGDEEQQHHQVIWEKVERINGLWVCRDFLSTESHSQLLNDILREGWFAADSQNQAMRFGDLPYWAVSLSSLIREAVCSYGFDSEHCGTSEGMSGSKDDVEKSCPLPDDLLWREPLFDQMIVNVYQPGEGICSHVDLMRFSDGIAIVSLESECVMHFTRSEETSASDNFAEPEEECSALETLPVLLTPGSLVLMSQEARYLWKHGINRKPGFQAWNGKEINQNKRTSVTLRRLCSAK